jgi:APA family basic amino acid/polyamine antiporter
MSPRTVFAREATGLLKEFSALDALALAISNIGLTYYFDPVTFYLGAYPQANIMVTTAIGLILVLPMVLLFALMTIAMPRTGGDYVWVSRTLFPSIGFIASFANTMLWLTFVGEEFTVAVQWGASAWFYQLGLLYNNPNYIAIGKYLTGADPAFWLGVVGILICGAIVLYSTRLTRLICRYWTFWGFLVGCVFIVAILATGPSVFKANFNALSGANYDQVIQDGQAAGAYAGIPPILSSASLYGGALRMLAIIGFNSSVYFSGELKNVRRSQFIGQIGATLLFVFFITLVVSTMYLGMGPSFANAMAILWFSGSSKFPWVTAPQTAGTSIFWVPNPILASIFSWTYILSAVVISIAILFAYTRNLFAWSFDRVMPTMLADVNSKTGTPVKATAVMIIISMFYAAVTAYAYGIVGTVLSYSTAGIILVYMIIAIAGIVFPYRRRDLFEMCHPTVRIKILGIPLLSILGVLSFVAGLITEWAILLPAGFNFVTIMFTGVLPTFILGAIIYGIIWALRRREGISLDFVGKVIPPE